MKKYLIVCGLITTLFTSLSMAAQPGESSGSTLPFRQGGETPEEFQMKKAQCPECVRVAQDIVQIRRQFCQQDADENETILRDPLYSYMNSIRMAAGGLYSPLYDAAKEVLKASVDCNNADNWVNKSEIMYQKMLSKAH